LLESITSFHEALRLLELNFGAISDPVASCLAAMGGVYLQMGNDEEAKRVFEDSAIITEHIANINLHFGEISVGKPTLAEENDLTRLAAAAAA